MRISVVMVILGGCAAEPSNWQDPDETLELAACGRPASDSFDLGQVAVDRGELVVHVAVGGGCADHAFAACWDGSVLDSFPGKVEIGLSDDDGGDACDAWLGYDLRIDLAPVLDRYAPPLDVAVTGARAQLAGTTSSVRIEP